MTKSSLTSLLVLVAVAALSCKGKQAPAGETANAGGPTGDASVAAANGDASWSATIDGVAVTGAGVDELQQQNSAYKLPLDGSSRQHLVFFIYSTRNGADQSANTSFRFWLPPAAGTYARTGTTESCDCSITLNTGIASGQELARFNSDTVTIVVTSMTATRVVGTFAGEFTLSGDTPREPKKKTRVTNGKFDLPMSTSKMTPE